MHWTLPRRPSRSARDLNQGHIDGKRSAQENRRVIGAPFIDGLADISSHKHGVVAGEEHVAEHAALWEMLTGEVGEVAARMSDLIDDLDAHMAAEERTFLSPLVLRHDVITRHRRQEPT